jgi:hypothetical protein
MNKEISDEAKRAIADLPRRKALQRLERDGATSTKAVQRRVRAIAEERKIPPSDVHKLMYKKLSVARDRHIQRKIQDPIGFYAAI